MLNEVVFALHTTLCMQILQNIIAMIRLKMNKILALAFSMIFVLGTGCTPGSLNIPRMSAAENLQHETIALVMQNRDKDRTGAYCSGVWISRTMILTAGHCAEPEKLHDQILMGRLLGRSEKQLHDLRLKETLGRHLQFLVYDDVGNKSRILQGHIKLRHADVTSYTHSHDLALLTVTDKQIPAHPFAHVSRAYIHNGDHLSVVGHPSGYWWTYSVAVVSHTRFMRGPFRHAFKVLHVNGHVWFGNSGGGAFDSAGNLVGISSYISRGPGLAFFVHRDVIWSFLVLNHVVRDDGRRP